MDPGSPATVDAAPAGGGVSVDSHADAGAVAALGAPRSAGNSRALHRSAAAVVALAVVLFWALASYGITSPFYYGHYGYHGGSYATWARGTLRHHTLLPVNEPGFAPPRPGTYYIHHPILTHQLVTLTFTIFGEHEWSVRLGALIPSFLSLLLVAGIAWRWLGPVAGATAALMFAIAPVNVWYSVNIDQGFPSIACLLGFFWFYLRWLQSGRWRDGVAALCLEALAGGFEWSPYFAFPMIFAHVAWTAWRRRGRYLSFGALHPLTVIVPLGLHAVAVKSAGMMNDLFTAYRGRAAEMGYGGFAHAMRLYGETLFGRVLLGAMFLWLGLTLVRVARGRGRAVDLVGLTFAFALLTYVHVFKVAVVTHAYRQLYGNVWAAMAVADLTVRARRGAEWLLTRSHRSPRAGAVAGVLVAAVVVIATAPVAWAGLIESRAHGGIPEWRTFNPDLRQTIFAARLNQATRPGDVLYFHPSFSYPPPGRMDWAFYYDRDLKRGISLRAAQRLSAAERKHAVAIAVIRGLFGDELHALAELARVHPVTQIDDLVMVDLRVDGAQIHAYTTSPADRGKTGALRRWLEGPYPWPRLSPDPKTERADQALFEGLLATPAPAPNAPLPARAARATPPPSSAARAPAAAAGPAAATGTSAAPVAAAKHKKTRPPRKSESARRAR